MTIADNDIIGIVFLDKPCGWTSRRAVNEVIRVFSRPGQKRIKAGHAGTLDPLATGMLPILLGDATRFAEMGLNAEKSYRVSFDLSYQTDTLDMEGEVCARFDAEISRVQLELLLPGFSGEIEQVPPAFSAIRIDGKRAHDLARKGERVAMQGRRITIHAIRLVAFEYPLVTLDVSCSKGTYIRSLARDIGECLGMGGCVTCLRRLSTGGWPEALMVTPEQLVANRESCLMPLSQWLRDFYHLILPGELARRFVQGQRIQLKDTKADAEEKNMAVFAEDILLGTGMLKGGMRHMVLHPDKIMPSAQKVFL
ncbi:MAG: tRNA pseudouridine(55) synthase TruB [Mariprofundus sp.]|nr:tRNA pseudouridine(55) synthase TruB [Mariprofundus sp.]